MPQLNQPPEPPFDVLTIDTFMVELWPDNTVAIIDTQTMIGVRIKIGDLMMIRNSLPHILENVALGTTDVAMLPYSSLQVVLTPCSIGILNIETLTGIKISSNYLEAIFEKANKRLQQHRAEDNSTLEP